MHPSRCALWAILVCAQIHVQERKAFSHRLYTSNICRKRATRIVASIIDQISSHRMGGGCCSSEILIRKQVPCIFPNNNNNNCVCTKAEKNLNNGSVYSVRRVVLTRLHKHFTYKNENAGCGQNYYSTVYRKIDAATDVSRFFPLFFRKMYMSSAYSFCTLSKKRKFLFHFCDSMYMSNKYGKLSCQNVYLTMFFRMLFNFQSNFYVLQTFLHV